MEPAQATTAPETRPFRASAPPLAGLPLAPDGSFESDFATADGERVMVAALTAGQWRKLVLRSSGVIAGGGSGTP